MILYPALDLKAGQCLCLPDGDASVAPSRIEKLDPVARAQHLMALGFSWLHITDLDNTGADRAQDSPELPNLAVVKKIIETVGISVQFGGVSTVKDVEALLSLGVERVVIDSSVLRDPFVIKDSCRLFPGRVAVGILAVNQIAQVGGWVGQRTIRALDLALMFEDYGAAAFVYADLESEGGMGGIDVEVIADLAFALTTPVIAAGELGSLADLEALKAEEESGIAGVICGRALLDSRIDAAEALRVAAARGL